jgi:uncharacterized protein (TIGR03437 family)
MFRISTCKISVAAFALLLCAGLAQAQTVPASPLTASPTSVSIGFTLPSTPGTANSTSLSVTAGSIPFVVDSMTVPFWLSVQNSSGTAISSGTVAAGTPLSVYFQATTAAGPMNAGAYTASVGFAVNGYQELTVSVTLTVLGANSTLTVFNGSTQLTSNGAAVTVPWTYGATAPALALTLTSTNDPITFSATSAVTGSSPEDWIELVNPNGIAYNYGTTLNVNFARDALINSTVGSTLTGSITIAYAGTNFIVNVSITVGEPAAAVTTVFPQETPAVASNGLQVVVTGSGFGTVAGGFTTATTVDITYGPAGSQTGPVNLTSVQAKNGGFQGSVTVVNPNTMILEIPYEDDAGTPVSILGTAGQTVTLTISNGAYNSTAATATLYVTSNPVVYAVTDAAALEEPTPGASPNVAPYELISIFGSNFCPTCTGPVVAPVASSRYPTTVTAPASGGNPVTVTFYKGTGTDLADLTSIASAYIVFVSNTQINALVPSTVAASDDPMQVVVSYNSIPSNENVVYTVNTLSANPGIFTTSSTGQGQGAVLNQDGTVNSSSNKATPGQTISIYASGLGTPNSTAADTAGKSAAKFPSSCISIASYVSAAALSNPATADGAVLDSADIETNMLPPCFATSGQVAVTIGGAAATVTYAGWVSGSVTGLYQINATIPSKATSGNLPVVVTVTNTVGTQKVVNTSQAGVTVAVN